MSLAWGDDGDGIDFDDNDKVENGARVYAGTLDAWTRPIPITAGGLLQIKFKNYDSWWLVRYRPAPFARALEEINRRNSY